MWRAISIPAIPDDPARDVLEHPGTTALFDKLIANGWLGNKSGQGFYKTMSNRRTAARISTRST